MKNKVFCLIVVVLILITACETDERVTGITLDRRTMTLTVGESQTLIATVFPDNATEKTVYWGSFNTNIATVCDSGIVTAVSFRPHIGSNEVSATTRIVASTKCGMHRAFCDVTVLPLSFSIYDCNNNAPGWGSGLGTITRGAERIISGWGVNQIWSDAVTATVCNSRTTFDGGFQHYFKADCRSNPDYPGDLFSWCAVVRFADSLCPAPWRVPTQQDFINLDNALGGNGSSNTNIILRDRYLNVWGGVYGGACLGDGSFVWNRGSSANYWSLSEWNRDNGRLLSFGTTGFVNPGSGQYPKNYGSALRCVRDTAIFPQSIGCNNYTPGWGSSGLGAITRGDERTISGNGVTQIWSDAVTATNCNKFTFSGVSANNFNADCRSNPGYPGDLFSWCAVVRFADSLCPAPWRVPTQQDFIDLDRALGGTGNGQTNSILANRYRSDWDGSFGGACDEAGSFFWNRGSSALYWSQTEGNNRSVYILSFNATSVWPQNNNSKGNGLTLRCVR